MRKPETNAKMLGRKIVKIMTAKPLKKGPSK
jgi:hypothetical protein